MKNNFTQRNGLIGKAAVVVGLCMLPMVAMAQSDWSYQCNACDAEGVGYSNISGQTLVGDMQWRGNASNSKYVRFAVNNVPEAGTYDLTAYYAQADTRSYLITVKQGDKKMCTVFKCKNTGTWDNIGNSVHPVNLFQGDNIVEVSALGNADVRTLTSSGDGVLWGANLNKIELRKSKAVLEDWSTYASSRELENPAGGSGSQKIDNCNAFTLEAENADYITEVEEAGGWPTKPGDDRMTIGDTRSADPVRGIRNTWKNDMAYYASVDFGYGVTRAVVRHTAVRPSKIAIYIDGTVDEANKTLVGGKLVGTIKITDKTGDWAGALKEYTAELSEHVSGIHSVAMVFSPDGDTNDNQNLGDMDWFKFYGRYQSLDNAGETPMIYNIGVPEAGKYLMEVDYATCQDRSFDLSVNGGEKVNIPCKVHSSAWNACTRTCYYIVELNEGGNRFEIYKNGDSPNLDVIRLTYLSEPKHEMVSVAYTMTAAEWGTLIVPFESMMPKNMTLYTCDEVNENGVLVLKEVERDYEVNGNYFQRVRQNVPYIVSGEKDAYMNFSGMALLDDAVYRYGCLAGTLKGTVAPQGSFVLQNQAVNGVGFYEVGEGGKQVNAFRAYMEVPDEAGVNFRTLMFPGNTTGIAEVTSEEDGVVNVYSINGMLVRRNVEKAKALEGLQKGIYIVNGVKKVVK